VKENNPKSSGIPGIIFMRETQPQIKVMTSRAHQLATFQLALWLPEWFWAPGVRGTHCLGHWGVCVWGGGGGRSCCTHLTMCSHLSSFYLWPLLM
jgi:hypothetical protein